MRIMIMKRKKMKMNIIMIIAPMKMKKSYPVGQNE